MTPTPTELYCAGIALAIFIAGIIFGRNIQNHEQFERGWRERDRFQSVVRECEVMDLERMRRS